MEHALVLRGKCVRANMRWNLGQTVPARAGDPTADRVDSIIIAILTVELKFYYVTKRKQPKRERKTPPKHHSVLPSHHLQVRMRRRFLFSPLDSVRLFSNHSSDLGSFKG
jgi:hypothetical protein